MHNLQKLMNKLQKIVKSAGLIITNSNPAINSAYTKDTFDFVTNIDFEVEKFIKIELNKIIPEYIFISEEMANNPICNTGGYWVLDPLDGTTNYINNLDSSAISLALVEDGIVILGIVYNPFKEELFSAIKGIGAFLNGKKISISNDLNIKRNICIFGIPYDRTKLKDILNYIDNLNLLFADFKRIGPSSLDICQIACGRATAYIELNLKIWDILAGKLILEESGGVMTLMNGSPIDVSMDEFSIIAGTPDMQKNIFKNINI